jgi:hypothetical protein
MQYFNTIIEQYGSKGEKSGWTFVRIPSRVLKKLALKDRRGFRIKGVMDKVSFEKLSTYPVGEGEFIIAINKSLKKKLGKRPGDPLRVGLGIDERKPPQSAELLSCFEQDRAAANAFSKLAPSHRNYFHRYVLHAKGASTRAKRIVNVLDALHRGLNFGEMIRGLKSRTQSAE